MGSVGPVWVCICCRTRTLMRERSLSAFLIRVQRVFKAVKVDVFAFDDAEITFEGQKVVKSWYVSDTTGVGAR